MKTVAILASKKIIAVQPTKIAASISVQGSGGSWRFRTVITDDIFAKLVEPLKTAISPKAVLEGEADKGIIIYLDRSIGTSVVSSTKSVAFMHSCRTIGAVEQKIAKDIFDALLITTEDGMRYIVTAPLPDAFLSTSAREKRRNYPANQRYNRVYENAYAAAFNKNIGSLAFIEDHKPASPPALDKTPAPQPVEPPKSEPIVSAPAPTIADPVIAKPEATAKTIRPISDLKDAIDMANAEIARFRDEGANVEPYIDEHGNIKARLRVVIENEI